VSLQSVTERERRLTRRQQWAIFCLAIWLTGTVISAVVATENFYTIDRLLASSPNAAFHDAVDKLGAPAARDLLWYLSSELNRLYFQYWNLAQLAIGILALWLVVPLPVDRRAVWGIVAMLAIVLFLTAVLTPPIVSIGRELDFVPREPPPAELRKFGLLHTAFTVATLINLILGVLATFWIQRAPEQ
jgi:hypothetical protein